MIRLSEAYVWAGTNGVDCLSTAFGWVGRAVTLNDGPSDPVDRDNIFEPS